MKYSWFRIGGIKLLVTMPHNWAFGHLALEILMAFALANREKATVYFIERSRVVNRALFRLKSDAVKTLPRTRWIAWIIRTVWSIRHVLMPTMRSDLEPGNSKQVEADNQSEPYFRRLLIRDPVPVHLSQKDQLEAARQAANVGIFEGTKIVTLHVREAGFRSRPGRPEDRSMSTRNARIESYDKAIDFLLEQGYFIVRIGDSTMTPLNRNGVLDLAKSDKRTELLELYCLMKSDFLLGCESGLLGVSYLINLPFLSVNATDPVSSYPIRHDGLYILKRVMDRKSENVLSLADMLKEDYLFNLRNLDRYEYIDNTSEEILEVTKEMVERLKAKPQPNRAQLEYKELISATVEDLKQRWDYIKKWGSEDGFLGDGWIGRDFAERNLYAG